MEDSKQETWSDYIDEADRLDAIAGKVTALANSVSKNDPGVAQKIAYAGLACKAHTDFRAMLILCKNGFADSAQVLSRTVFEACQNFLYIQQNPDEHALAYWGDTIRKTKRILNASLKHPCYSDKPDSAIKTKIEELESGASPEMRWPSNLSAIAKTLGEPMKLVLHDIIIEHLTCNIHSLSTAIEDWYLIEQKDWFFIRRDSDKACLFSFLDVPIVLFGQIIVELSKEFELELDEVGEIEQMIFEIQASRQQ